MLNQRMEVNIGEINYLSNCVVTLCNCTSYKVHPEVTNMKVVCSDVSGTPIKNTNTVDMDQGEHLSVW